MMQIIKIKTSQNIDIDYEVAGLGDRMLAWFIDVILMGGIAYVIAIICVLAFAATFQRDSGLPAALIVIGVLYSLAVAFYDLVAEIFFNGQTVGKKAIKIRVININGSRPTTGQFFLRWIFRLIDVGLTFGIAAVIAIAVSDKKQRIGDIVAGTTVIKTKPKTQLSDLYFASPEENYEPVFTGVTIFKDTDVTLIYEVLNNFKSTRNSRLIFDMALRVKDHLGITIPPEMNEFDFLQTIVKDYSYITSQAVI